MRARQEGFAGWLLLRAAITVGPSLQRSCVQIRGEESQRGEAEEVCLPGYSTDMITKFHISPSFAFIYGTIQMGCGVCA